MSNIDATPKRHILEWKQTHVMRPGIGLGLGSWRIDRYAMRQTTIQ